MHNIFPATAARLSQWKARPDVLGVILVGSKSRVHADELSDDDLEVLLTDQAFALLRPSECSELAFEGEDQTGKLIYDAQYISFTAVERKLTSPLDLDHWPYEQAKVLFDRKGNIATTVENLGRLEPAFRHTRLLYSTINAMIAISRATKTLQRGYEAAGHLIVARGAKALSNLLFALEWRWVPMDHWLENELRTLEDPTHAGLLLIEALTIGKPEPLREALNGLEDRLASEGVPRPGSRRELFFELIHPSRAEDMAIHGVF
jgi:hypothetical protein